MDAPTVITTGIVTPQHALTISPHYLRNSMDQSYSHSISSNHLAQDSQPRKIKQCPRPLTPHKPHCGKIVIIDDSSSDSSSDSDSDSDPLS